ncbi:MAG: hypothetical protein QOF51_1050 [Chloroflexota bacterium]|jgi:adenylate kinase family enzyme|nr:hypothetical protein [Chloroflexota bacterium]
MQRVLVLGPSGAGKSTLARQLGELLDLPVCHLDQLFWLPGWVEAPREVFDERLAEVIAGNAWVIDGNYSRVLEARLARADTAIYLDFPRRLCYYRVVKRLIQYHGRPRPDMGEECPEKIDWEFIQWIWGFPSRSRPRILARLAACPPEQRVHILRGPRAVNELLAGLPRTGADRAQLPR